MARLSRQRQASSSTTARQSTNTSTTQTTLNTSNTLSKNTSDPLTGPRPEDDIFYEGVAVRKGLSVMKEAMVNQDE